MQAFIEIEEVRRLPSPAPAPQGIAFDGTTLWIGSLQTQRIYAIDPLTWTARDEATAPGEPFGITVVGDELRFIIGLGDDADDRYIYRFVPGHGFKERIECPELSGAFLAYDGDELFLSQAHNKKILALDDRAAIVHEIPLDRRPVGMTIVNGCIYLVTTDDEWTHRQLTKVDARQAAPVVTPLGAFAFNARGLAFDGTRFWTCARETNEIVAFTAPTK